MRSIDSSGRSIDEAIFNGLKQLEISIDEVEIEILQQETKGVLGIGAKPAIVRLTERQPEEIVVPAYLTEKPVHPRSERSDRYDRPARGGRDRREGRSQNAGQNRERAPREERRSSAPETQEPLRSRIEYGVPEENDAAAAFLSGMLQRMGVTAEVLSAKRGEEDGVRMCINSDTMGMLIGHRGETLDAMQYITSLVVNRNRKEEGYTRVTLDTEGYREKREETLTRLARKIAAQVKATGKARVLEPMNPYERRVLHATLQNNSYVTTHSEGEEPNRRVVVEPK